MLRSLLLLPALSVPAAAQAADIYYDEHAIAHVFGATDESAFYAYGYYQVTNFPIGLLDVLWRFSGRFSEIVGPSYLDQDYEWRLWEIEEVAERQYNALPSDLRDLVDAYAAGVEAGRTWWRDGEAKPTDSARIKALLGTTSDPSNVVVHVQPLPNYLNQAVHPFSRDENGVVDPDYDPARVPEYVAAVVDRLFDPAFAVTPQRVLAFYAAWNAGPGVLNYTAISTPAMSNLWLVSPPANGGALQLVTDPHAPVDGPEIRPSIVQLEGDTYSMTGTGRPGALPFVGGNDHLVFGTSGTPNDTVYRTTWGSRLAATLPLAIQWGTSAPDRGLAFVGKTFPHRVRLDRLEVVPDTFTFYDVVESVKDSTTATHAQARTRYYVRDHGNVGFPNDRLPVVRVDGKRIDGESVLPSPGQTIQFQQAAFTSGRSMFEYFARLGRARSIDGPSGETVKGVLDDVLWGWAKNSMFGDSSGRAFCYVGSRVPKQGAAVADLVDPDEAQALHKGQIVLDGGRPDHRWQGFHGIDGIVHIEADLSAIPEVWIANNDSPERIEVGPSLANPNDDRLTLGDMALFPLEVAHPDPSATWKGRRTRELLSQGDLMSDDLIGASAAAGLELVDNAVKELWPFFEEARELVDPMHTNADVDAFLAWVNVHRHLTADGLTYDPGVDFVAHEYSLQTVYTQPLLDAYLNRLRVMPGLTALQAAFGEDPLHPLLDDPFALTAFGASYAPNVDAMWSALTVDVVPLWLRGSGDDGIQNHAWIQERMLEPWFSDPRYDDDQTSVDAAFAATMGGTKVTRWGMVHMVVATPHALPPVRATELDPQAGLFPAHLFSALAPDLLGTVNMSHYIAKRLQFPANTGVAVHAYPTGGTSYSQFASTARSIFVTGKTPRGAIEGIYDWDPPSDPSPSPDDVFYFIPQTQGSQCIWLATVDTLGAPLDYQFCTFAGSTEITTTGILPHQDRFELTPAFAARTWTVLERDPSVLSLPSGHVHHEALVY